MSKSFRKCVWNGLRVTLYEPMRCGCERDRRLLHPRIHWEFQDCLQDNNYCRKRDSELTIDRDERKKKGARIAIEDVKKILKETNSMIAVVEQASGKDRGAAHQSTQPSTFLRQKNSIPGRENIFVIQVEGPDRGQAMGKSSTSWRKNYSGTSIRAFVWSENIHRAVIL